MIGSAPDGTMSFFRTVERDMNSPEIDVAIVDEVSQALEVPTMVPILEANRCILAGDLYQLPPTITVDISAFESDPLNLLERVDRQFGEMYTKRLAIQYRMNKRISNWSSLRFYDGLLVPDYNQSTS